MNVGPQHYCGILGYHPSCRVKTCWWKICASLGITLPLSAPQDVKKRHQNKVKVKGLGRNSSYLAGFSIFFMALWKNSISWLKKKKKKKKVNVYNTYASTFTGKKTSKPLQNTLFYALVSIICGGKPLITTNKLAGPVGKKGFWVGYIGCEMHEKPQKK